MTHEKRVLIIDDELDFLDSIKERLNAHHFYCATASSAPSALREISRFRPHLVLLDLGLVGMSGFGFLREMRRNPAYSHIPVVILSGISDDEVVREGMALGAIGYLHKPFKVRELVLMVTSYSV